MPSSNTYDLLYYYFDGPFFRPNSFDIVQALYDADFREDGLYKIKTPYIIQDSVNPQNRACFHPKRIVPQIPDQGEMEFVVEIETINGKKNISKMFCNHKGSWYSPFSENIAGELTAHRLTLESLIPCDIPCLSSLNTKLDKVDKTVTITQDETGEFTASRHITTGQLDTILEMPEEDTPISPQTITKPSLFRSFLDYLRGKSGAAYNEPRHAKVL